MKILSESRAVVCLCLLCLAGLSTVATASPYSDLILADGPVGYWRLGETAGTTAADATGGNNGVYLNGVTLGWPGAIQGDPDLAAGFNGSNHKVDVPYSAALNPASFSFECWAKVAAGTDANHRSPVTSRNDGPQQGYIFYAQGGRWQFWTGPGWNNVQAPPNSVVEGEWAHLVGAYDAVTQQKRFYVNGVPAGSASGVTIDPNNARPLRIGGGATEGAGNYWFRGDVDEVAVYDGALSPDRIRAHYLQATRGAYTPVEIFRADFANPGGAGLGPDASRMEFAGQTGASPTPRNPDGELILGGSGSGGMVFTDPLPAFDLTGGPMLISTQARFVNQDAPDSQANAYMGLKALHLKGTSDTGAERRGGLWAQFQPYTTGDGHIRLGFQTDSTATGGDLWVDNLFARTIGGIPDANGPFDMELAIYGLEDADALVYTVTQGPYVAEIATTIGDYRNAVSGAAGDALDLVLAELKADPNSMNYGLISTDRRDDGYSFLSVQAGVEEIIPEPASILLVSLAAAGLGGYVRRRRRA